MLLMGKVTISMAIFNSELLNYQRVISHNITTFYGLNSFGNQTCCHPKILVGSGEHARASARRQGNDISSISGAMIDDPKKIEQCFWNGATSMMFAKLFGDKKTWVAIWPARAWQFFWPWPAWLDFPRRFRSGMTREAARGNPEAMIKSSNSAAVSAK